MLKNIFKNKAFKTFFTYAIAFATTITVLFILMNITKMGEFLVSMENRTFDLRQNLISNYNNKKINKNIVLVVIDEASYEYVLEKYGDWPIPRNVYADFVNYVQKQHPKAIAFDLMFVNSMKSRYQADATLINVFKKYDNIYTAMNFDNAEFDIRKPVILPQGLSVSVKNNSDVNFHNDLEFTNCRSILPEILSATNNVGLINVSRDNDGMLREVPPFMIYQKKFYPQMALLVALKYLGIDKREFTINKNNEIEIDKNHSIPLGNNGEAILSWYGPANNSFTQIPLYKVIKAMNGDADAQKFDFKNKIIYVGTTAVSLYDTKSVPVDKIYPGVGIHATFINNLIDNNFIKKVDDKINILAGIILAILVGYIVIKTSSNIIALGSTILISFGYALLSYFLMRYFSLWISIILPITMVLLIFTCAYIVKYVIKSKDFEYQYRLATTDGLTELFNHRYFQEQMIMQIENCKRYDSSFSLILIDIDFFKKFNDTYGHQAGDAVLKQVAQKLKKNVRATDIVCRYGGEEMSIILPNTDKDEAIFTAQKICQAIAEKPFKLGNEKESNVTISLGLATFPQDGETPAQLIECSDKGLYIAKENGRNQVGL